MITEWLNWPSTQKKISMPLNYTSLRWFAQWRRVYRKEFAFQASAAGKYMMDGYRKRNAGYWWHTCWQARETRKKWGVSRKTGSSRSFPPCPESKAWTLPESSRLNGSCNTTGNYLPISVFRQTIFPMPFRSTISEKTAERFSRKPSPRKNIRTSCLKAIPMMTKQTSWTCRSRWSTAKSSIYTISSRSITKKVIPDHTTGLTGWTG